MVGGCVCVTGDIVRVCESNVYLWDSATRRDTFRWDGCPLAILHVCSTEEGQVSRSCVLATLSYDRTQEGVVSNPTTFLRPRPLAP